jgi:RNA polymerase sigma factor (sigma-70 family)
MSVMKVSTATVRAAQRGDEPAFRALVEAHQGAAHAYALVLLRHEDDAAEATQEAFFEAHRRLGQLREPAAFASWLRRIVFKHVDRRRRRARLQVPLEEGLSVDAPGPDGAVEEERRRRRLLRAVETLPPHERIVVALHYLGGLTVPEIAAFLEIGVSAGKKRLFSARRRLRRALPSMKEEPMSTPHAFADPIALFLALRAGDGDTVDALLDRRPALLDAVERWPDAEAVAGGFGLAHAQTPLILAAARGDLAMVERLLRRGAEVDGRCACDSGETALWRASRQGHREVVARLLDAGADPTVRVNGLAPLDLALWRRDASLVALLGGEGVPPPWTAAARVHDDGRVDTGIKALDLLCPLREGDVVEVLGPAETGLTALFSEVTAAVRAAGGDAVWTSWEPHPWSRGELAEVAGRAAVSPDVVVGPPRDALAAGLRRCEAAAGPTLHVVFEHEGAEAEVEAVYPRMAAAATVTWVVRPWAAVTRGGLPDRAAPVDGRVFTDPRLAARGLWPAIDPDRTGSRHRDALGDRAAARLSSWLAGEVAPRGERLAAYLTQGFRSAEPDSGIAGVSVPAAQMRADVARILEGELGGVTLDSLRYRGAL